MMFLKALVRNAVRRYGYLIQKYPITTFSPVSVFDLSIQFLMAVRGQRLNFIQVGANDGKSGDPLHRYILNYPWHGILVEPQPDIFAKLRENYAAIANRLIFENIAIATGLSTIAMYKNPSGHPNPEAAFLVSTSPQVAARSFGLRAQDLERFFVPCATLDELVRKHSMSNIDVLQIDAEGGDFDVLKTLDLSKTSPLIVQFEHGHLTPQKISGAVDYLNSHGYRVLYGGHQIDSLALHKSFPLLDAA
jgi:FkbM family methyltransferase